MFRRQFWLIEYCSFAVKLCVMIFRMNGFSSLQKVNLQRPRGRKKLRGKKQNVINHKPFFFFIYYYFGTFRFEKTPIGEIALYKRFIVVHNVRKIFFLHGYTAVIVWEISTGIFNYLFIVFTSSWLYIYTTCMRAWSRSREFFNRIRSSAGRLTSRGKKTLLKKRVKVNFNLSTRIGIVIILYRALGL